MSIKHLILTVVVSVLVTACQTAGDDGTKPSGGFASVSTEGMKQGCFYVRDVNNFDSLNQVNLIVYAPSSTRPYLLTISPPSTALRSASNIAFTGSRGRVCGRAGDSMEIGRGADRPHTIMDVRVLDKEQAEDMLAMHKGGAAAVPAEASPGAEIEPVSGTAEDAAKGNDEGSDE
jgi:hypothetical protein